MKEEIKQQERKVEIEQCPNCMALLRANGVSIPQMSGVREKINKMKHKLEDKRPIGDYEHDLKIMYGYNQAIDDILQALNNPNELKRIRQMPTL